MCGCAKCLSREQYVGSSARVDALCSSYSLQKYLERWPAASYEAGQSVLMLMKGSKIPRIELNTVHLYQHYSLFMPNKIQYSWRGVYCECVRPAQLPILTEVRAPSLLEQYPWYVPHWDRAGYNLFTYSMVQSPSWEANWFAASQEIPHISRNPKVHYHTHKRPPPISILGQPNPVHIPTSHLLEIHPNFIDLSTPRSPQWSPSLQFPHQDPTHPLS